MLFLFIQIFEENSKFCKVNYNILIALGYYCDIYNVIDFRQEIPHGCVNMWH